MFIQVSKSIQFQFIKRQKSILLLKTFLSHRLILGDSSTTKASYSTFDHWRYINFSLTLTLTLDRPTEALSKIRQSIYLNKTHRLTQRHNVTEKLHLMQC